MSRILKAALLYFAAVFGAGFLLGTLRVLWIAPQIGERAAELAEMPLMLAVIVLAARRIVRGLRLEATPAARLGMGVIALALLLTCELTLVLGLRGISLRSYFVNQDPLTAAAYYAALGLFAALPLFAPPMIARPRRAALASALAVIAIASAVIYGNYGYDLGVERARVAAGSAIAQTACGPIEYASLGEGPAVLVVHGAGGGFDQMLDIAQALAASGFRAIAVSRFGHLRTPLPADASPAAQADAHACLLDALKIERAAVFGASAGAPSSMQLAIRHPQRVSALVLMVPLAYAPGRPAVPPSRPALFMFEQVLKSDFLFWAVMTLDPDLVVTTILGTPAEAVANARLEERLRVRDMMRHILPVSRRQQGLLNEARIAAALLRYDLESIVAPTLVVSFVDDGYGTYASAKYTAEHIPGALFIGYASGGHMGVEHHDEMLAALRIFLGASPALGVAP